MENKNKKQCSIEVNIHIRLKVTADASLVVLYNLWFTDMNITLFVAVASRQLLLKRHYE